MLTINSCLTLFMLSRQIGTDRNSSAQIGTDWRHRSAQFGTDRHRSAQFGTDRHISAAQIGTVRHRSAQQLTQVTWRSWALIRGHSLQGTDKDPLLSDAFMPPKLCFAVERLLSVRHTNIRLKLEAMIFNEPVFTHSFFPHQFDLIYNRSQFPGCV